VKDRTRKPFAMIREFQLADWFTLGNAVCGTAALFATITYVQTEIVGHIYFACGLVFAALIFDILDGRIARWRQKASSTRQNIGVTNEIDVANGLDAHHAEERALTLVPPEGDARRDLAMQILRCHIRLVPTVSGNHAAVRQRGAALKVYAETADNNMLSTSATDFGT
jgi:hypothetical protein